MSKSKPTLQDIAEMAGVSLTAVSLTLRGHPKSDSFNAETVSRIREAAGLLGYRANCFSAATRGEGVKVIMLYLATLEDIYSSSIVECFQQEASRRGYWTMIHIMSDNERPEFDERIIGSHGVAAVAIISAAADRIRISHIKKLKQEHVQVVVIGRDKACPGISDIVVDDYRGGWLAAEHVYGLGARHIWLMGYADDTRVTIRKRSAAIYDYAKEHGLAEPEYVVSGDELDDLDDRAIEISEKSYRLVRKQLAASSRLPDAIIANLDLRAMGVYRALYEAGYQPGKDVAVMGYDDIWPSRMITPSLTTIHQPTEEMGRAAATILIDGLEGRSRSGRRVSLEPELVARDSTRLWKPKEG